MKKFTMLVYALLAFSSVDAFSMQFEGLITSNVLLQSGNSNFNLLTSSKESLNQNRKVFDDDSSKRINPFVAITERPSQQTSPPDSPEALARLAEREAKDGIVKHSLGLDPNGSKIPANYSPESLKDALRGAIAYGNDLDNNNFYSIDVSNCYTTQIGTASYSAFGGDFVNLDDENMYIIDYNDDWLKTVDVTTGIATPVAYVPCPMGPGGVWTELAIDKMDDTFYLTATDINQTKLYKVNPDNGELILVGNTGIAAIISCTIDLAGIMYALDIVTDNIYTIDLETGIGTVLGPAGFNANYAQGMGYDVENDIVYLAAYSAFAELRTLDRTTGATTSVGLLPGETGAFGFPYLIPWLPDIDVGVQYILSPVSGSGLGEEIVTIRVKNYGMNTLSNIPVSYTLDGGTPVTGIVPGPIASGEMVDFTFPGTVNLGNIGQTYVFESCTFLEGDENPVNNCKTHNVTNLIPGYCDASTQIEDEYIANVHCGWINNSSGWQGGVADFSEIYTYIDAGGSETIVVTNGNAWANDIVYCWADWDQDFEFEEGNELFMLTNIGGVGQTFTGTITVPAGLPNGDYRLRIRMTYSTPPEPCDNATYGEVEDYTIKLGTCPPALPGPDVLYGTFVPPNSAYLAWFYGGGNGEWLQHCGPNVGGMGLEDGGTFYVSAFWDEEMLASYYGYYMTKASIFPTSTDNASYELMVWTDENGGTTLVSQPLTGLVMDEWNDIELTLPVEIIPENNLWVGYKVTHNEGDNPVGLDDGPAVAGYGDMVSLDGVTWESLMNSYGMDFNFTIKAMVTNDVDGQIAQPLPNHGFKNQTHHSSFVFEKRTKNPAQDKPRLTMLGHNIYRDEVLIGFANVTQETYIDCNLFPGVYSYSVRAVYEEGLSEPTEAVTVLVPEIDTLIYEPFEDYTSGGYLAQQANAMGRPYWTTWSNAPGTAEDPIVSNEQASTGSNSMVIEGSNDCVLLLGDKTAGNYDLDFDFFVAAGHLGYFNLLHYFAGPDSEWGLQVYFDENGAGTVDAGGIGAASFSFGYDEWIPIKVNVNLDDDWCKLYINNSLVVGYQWSLGTSGTPGLNQLAAANFYAWSDQLTSKYFVDEIDFNEAEIPPPAPTIQIEPMSLEETHPNPPMITTKIVTVTNTGEGTLNWDLTVTIDPFSTQTSPPDSPEAIERMSQRQANDGIVKHSLGLDPNGSKVPANYSPEKLKDALRGEIAYGNDIENNTFYEIDLNGGYTIISPASFIAFGGDFNNGDEDMYIIDWYNDLLSIVDVTTGLATPVAYVPCPMGPSGIWTELAIDKRDNTFYIIASDVNESNLYKVNPDNGELILVGNTGIAAIVSCTIDLDGIMYALDIVTDNIYTIDLETGMGTVLGPAGFNANYAQGMGYDVYNDIVYLAAYSTYAELRTLDKSTGATTSIGILPGQTGAFGFPYLFIWQPDDVGVYSFVSPVSGPGLGEEIVTIRIKNFGSDTQSNIPVSYSLDGGSPVTGIVPGPIASGEMVDFTFPGTVNLGNPGQAFVFVGCTALEGDVNPANDCKTMSIVGGVYCWAATTTEDEYIANVLCGDIDNSSGWQGGVADYTDISTIIDAGTAQEITVTNGNAWASDIVYCWVDWDKDFEFEGGSELYMLNNVGGTGQIFTGSIYVPSDTQLGEYRLRIRMTYSTAPQPCGEATYGEVEDYTINVEIVNPNPWLSAVPITGTLDPGHSTNVFVTFNSEYLPMGSYSGLLTFTSNDPVNPVVNVPAIITCGTNGGIISVTPDLFNFYMEYNQTEVQTMTIFNAGLGTLDCELDVDIYWETPDITIFDIEEYRNSQSTAYLFNEKAPEKYNSTQVNNTDAMWDLQFSAPCGDGSGEAGIETDGNYIFTTKWNGTGFFKYGMDGTFIGPMSVGNVQGIRDLAFDGTYFYGGAAATTVYKMDFSTQTLIGQFTAPTAVRAIAYDYDEEGFYANNWSTPIVLFDMSGATLITIPTAGDESYYGFAYDNNDGNKYLYGFSQKVGLSGGVIFELALPSGTPTGVSHDVVSELANPGTDLAGGLFTCNNWIIDGTTSLGGLVQNVVLFAYELHEAVPDELLYLSDYELSVEPGESVDVDVICSTYISKCFPINAVISIVNNSLNNPLVEVDVWIYLPDAIDNHEKEAVILFPNPTNSQTHLKSDHEISLLRIFNQSGQMVYSENVSGTEASINTSGLPSGNYIVEITTEGGISTQKLILK